MKRKSKRTQSRTHGDRRLRQRPRRAAQGGVGQGASLSANKQRAPRGVGRRRLAPPRTAAPPRLAARSGPTSAGIAAGVPLSALRKTGGGPRATASRQVRFRAARPTCGPGAAQRSWPREGQRTVPSDVAPSAPAPPNRRPTSRANVHGRHRARAASIQSTRVARLSRAATPRRRLCHRGKPLLAHLLPRTSCPCRRRHEKSLRVRHHSTVPSFGVCAEGPSSPPH
mmetsp:Transcript_12735/g.34211  ORF Transcript_12735/g.34211 Transcript_12735/m.34211 type:complete len:226 (+) Transcript_12735:383-1060(+)